MGKIIDEYKDIKLQQECVSKTIDTLWKMAQKYQKIKEIVTKWHNDPRMKMTTSYYYMAKITEVLEDGND